MHPALDDVTVVLTMVDAPVHPVMPPTEADWTRRAKELAIPAFPNDFKRLVTALGTGTIGEGVLLENPRVAYAVSDEMFAGHQTQQYVDDPRLKPWNRGSNGVLPIGTTIDGDYLFLKVEGRDPNTWTVVLAPRELDSAEVLNVNVSRMLRLWLENTRVPQLLSGYDSTLDFARAGDSDEPFRFALRLKSYRENTITGLLTLQFGRMNHRSRDLDDIAEGLLASRRLFERLGPIVSSLHASQTPGDLELIVRGPVDGYQSDFFVKLNELIADGTRAYRKQIERKNARRRRLAAIGL